MAQAWHQVGVLPEPDNGDGWYRLARALAEQAAREAADNYLKALDASPTNLFQPQQYRDLAGGNRKKRHDPVQ